MANVGDLNVRINVDTDELNVGIRNAQNSIEGLRARLANIGQSMVNVGKTMTTSVTLPLLAIGGASIKLASDMQENINKVDVVFKDNAEGIKEWSKTTLSSFGIANVTALDMVSLFGDMATSQGLVTGEAAEMSKSLVGLAGDLASMKNINIEVAQTALKGVFTGETESLKGLGIVMTDANLKLFALSKGINTNIKDMTQAEKTNLRYAFVLNATSNSHGDFARTSGGAANQMRLFKETLKELGVMFGETILPVFTKAIKKLNEILNWVGKLSPSTKKWTMVIGGLVAAIGPLLVVLGTFLIMIASMTAPMWIAIGVIGALSVAGYLLYTNWDKIKNALSQIFGDIFFRIKDYMSKVKIVVLWVLEKVLDGFSKFIGFLIKVTTAIVNFKNKLLGIKESTSTAVNALNKLQTSTKNLLSTVKNSSDMEYFNKTINKTAHEMVMADLKAEDLALRMGDLKSKTNATAISQQDLSKELAESQANYDSTTNKTDNLSTKQNDLSNNVQDTTDKIDEQSEALENQSDKLEKVKEQIVKHYDKLGTEIIKALDKRYNEEEKMQRKATTYRMNNATFETNNIIKLYEKMSAAKIKALDDTSSAEITSIQTKIDQINSLTEKEDRDLEENEFQKQLILKESKLASVKNEEDKQGLLEDIAEMNSRRERKLLLQNRKDEIESLKESIVNIKNNAEKEKEEELQKLAAKKTFYEETKKIQDYYFDKELEDLTTKYDDLKKEENIQEEARRLALSTSNDELIDLLKTYNPKWKDAGKSFGEKLLEGLQSVSVKIETEINKIMSKMNAVSIGTSSTVSTPTLPVIPSSNRLKLDASGNNTSNSSNTTFNITETQNASATAREVVKILRLQGVRA